MNPEYFRNMSQDDFRSWLNNASDAEMTQALAVILNKISELTAELIDEMEYDLMDEDQDFAEARAVIDRVKAL